MIDGDGSRAHMKHQVWKSEENACRNERAGERACMRV